MEEAGGEKAERCRVGRRHRDSLGWEPAESKAGWQKGAWDSPQNSSLGPLWTTALPLLTQSLAGSTMSSDSSKKRKPKVIRTDGGPQEGKRSKADADQVGCLAASHGQSLAAVAGCLCPPA